GGVERREPLRGDRDPRQQPHAHLIHRERARAVVVREHGEQTLAVYFSARRGNTAEIARIDAPQRCAVVARDGRAALLLDADDLARRGGHAARVRQRELRALVRGHAGTRREAALLRRARRTEVEDVRPAAVLVLTPDGHELPLVLLRHAVDALR